MVCDYHCKKLRSAEAAAIKQVQCVLKTNETIRTTAALIALFSNFT